MTTGDTVWAYDAASAPTDGWSSFVKDGPTPSLTTMVDGKGYWVIMSTGATLAGTGKELPLPPETPPTYTVVEGWNLIGFKSLTPRTAGDYLAAIAGDYTVIYRFTGGVFSAVQASDNMILGEGYWIAITATTGTIYP